MILQARLQTNMFLYGEENHYSNRQEYIDEVVNMNALKDENITAGQHIILPYYSPEFNS